MALILFMVFAAMELRNQELQDMVDFAYLFHTIGELCLSKALSFITSISSKICFFNDGSLFCGNRNREQSSWYIIGEST
jgi:dipeptide/tripeptide permease